MLVEAEVVIQLVELEGRYWIVYDVIGARLSAGAIHWSDTEVSLVLILTVEVITVAGAVAGKLSRHLSKKELKEAWAAVGTAVWPVATHFWW
jgi:hypothetical protein